MQIGPFQIKPFADATHLRLSVALLGALALLTIALSAPSAHAAAVSTPGWTIHSFATPTNFLLADNESARCSAPSGFVGCDSYQVTATNAGERETDGSPVILTDTLPAVPTGLSVQRIALHWTGPGARALGIDPTFDLGFFCDTTTVQCTFPITVQPDDALEMVIYLTVPSAIATLENSATVSGGGAPSVSTDSRSAPPNTLNQSTPAFGPAFFDTYVAGPDGLPETQAAGHPYEMTTRIDLNNAFKLQPDGTFGAGTVQDPKDISVDLPLGFLGSALATPTCTFAQLSSHIQAGEGGCPKDTILGHIFTEPVNGDSVSGPIYNMAAEHGVAAEFGFVDLLAGSHVLYANVAPTPAGYVLRSTSPDIPQVPLTDVIVTLFGNPAVRDNSGITPVALFTNPSDCSATGLSSSVHMDSWQNPGPFAPGGQPDLTDPRWVSTSSPYPTPTGCNKLQFASTLSLQPDTTVADSPSGVDVDIKVPQSEQPNTLGTPPLKKAVVRLPEGFTVNPGAADGLGACSPAQVALESAAPPDCPDSSKIGSVALTTPLLAGTLEGSIYLASQYQNPFGSLLAGYIVVEDPTTGTVVKIAGELKTSPSTGQITGVFDNNPQFPFSELKLHFKGGPRGSLATPESCGVFTTTSAFTPWSAPDSGPDANPFDSFTIDSGCVSGFAPSFSAGTTIAHAGAYTPFVMSLSRSDTDQELSGLSVTLPPGLLAKVAGIQLCSEAQVAAAAANPSGVVEKANSSCPAASQVASVLAGAGPGPSPLFVSGKAYLTGPYKNGPYGLAVVVPAVAGPFDLGNVVVRAALHIDPTDGHVTAISDPFPTILNNSGIPVRLRRVDVTMDRPSFTFNPTSCAPMAIAATLSSTGGLSRSASSRFEVGGCQELPFKPGFSASTQGKTSKANGASLTVKVAQSPGQANIAKVNVQLPLALPSRLTTLQKACTEAQFNANPSGCPEGSNVGSATASTPVLNVPLTGPAYLVSHGSAAFPDLEFVLQGEGVKIVLDGKTDIKKGITYSKFETVPDAPISSFQTVLPEGPHSVLAANGNLCAPTKTVTIKKRVSIRSHGKVRHVVRSVKQSVPAPLVMPTTITGQNGVVVKQSTKISVTGCGKAPAKAGHKAKGRRKKLH
jgi:hypothetical protein